MRGPVEDYSVRALADMCSIDDFLLDRFRADQLQVSALRAAEWVESGAELRLRPSRQSGRDVFLLADGDILLALRRAAKLVRLVVGIESRSRQDIIRATHSVLSQPFAYQIFRGDIHRFFESISRDSLRGMLANELLPAFPRTFDICLRLLAAQGGPPLGVPPGNPLSAALAEMVLQPFDRGVKRLDDLLYYTRYVDDFLVVCGSRPAMQAAIGALLPQGMALSARKTLAFQISAAVPVRVPPGRWDFDFLGYNIGVTPLTDTSRSFGGRCIEWRLASRKKSRVKRRILLSLQDFAATGDSLMLERRLRFLTSSSMILPPVAAGRRTRVGLRHSYDLIGAESPDLLELDECLRRFVTRGCPRAALLPLPATERRKVMRYGFRRGWSMREAVRLDAALARRIAKVWRHV